MTPEKRMMILAELKKASEEDHTFMADAILYMQQGVNKKIEQLKSQALENELIAVAMHSKANQARHTEKSKLWVDGIISRYGKNDSNSFTNVDFTEVLE